MSMTSTRLARSLMATAVTALALSMPAAGLANKGGVPNSNSTAPKTTLPSNTPKAKKPCKDKDRGKAKRKGASHGKKRGANRGRKCGQK